MWGTFYKKLPILLIHLADMSYLTPGLITLTGLVCAYYVGGTAALVTAGLLIMLEVALSFDNAVVNAKVLKTMEPLWQKRFLTWGMLIAVFGTRVALPIGIVSVVAMLSPTAVLNMLFTEPEQYAALLDAAHYSIASFGGMFLLMVALHYFIDDTKEVHWLYSLEYRLTRLAPIESFQIAVAVCVLITVALMVPVHAAAILLAGCVGLVLYICMEGLASVTGGGTEGTVAMTGFSAFMYLNVLDSAFSLDGVVGAFALTSNIVLIAIGLGIGAYFVRYITILLVQRDTLATLRYLEHGAHYAVGALALCMLGSLVWHIPEILVGSIGLVCVACATYSSYQYQKKNN
jgi:uncharacterized protein